MILTLTLMTSLTMIMLSLGCSQAIAGRLQICANTLQLKSKLSGGTSRKAPPHWQYLGGDDKLRSSLLAEASGGFLNTITFRCCMTGAGVGGAEAAARHPRYRHEERAPLRRARQTGGGVNTAPASLRYLHSKTSCLHPHFILPSVTRCMQANIVGMVRRAPVLCHKMAIYGPQQVLNKFRDVVSRVPVLCSKSLRLCQQLVSWEYAL